MRSTSPTNSASRASRLISSGIYRCPVDDAIAASIDTIATPDTQVKSAVLVAFRADMYSEVCGQLKARHTSLDEFAGD